MLRMTTVALAAAAIALPVMAQTPAPPSQNTSPAAMTAPATQSTGGSPTAGGYNTPSARNPIMTDNGGMRTSKIVGSAVYNDKDEKIGSIDDLVIGTDRTLNAEVSWAWEARWSRFPSTSCSSATRRTAATTK